MSATPAPNASPPTSKARPAPVRGPDGRFAKRAAPPAAPRAPAPALVRVAPRPAPRPPASAPAAARAPAPAPAGRGMRVALIATLLLVVASAGFATMATGQDGNGNSGTIKVHDGTSADPPNRNEPHVEGDAFVEGFNMAATEGTLDFWSWPPTGDKELVLSTTWEADGEEPANHFLAGPFELPCGHYRVEAQNGLEEDDFPGGTKSKMFWVECSPAEEPPCEEDCEPEPCEEEPCPPPCGEPGGEPCPEEPPCGEPGGEPCPEPQPEMECPAALAAVANEDGSVTLTWTVAEGSDGTNVYRADGDGDFEWLATVAEGVTTYTDTTTVAGEAYAFTVTGLYGDAESTDCPVVEVTAIPEFPTVFALGAASGAGLLAMVLARRRKA